MEQTDTIVVKHAMEAVETGKLYHFDGKSPIVHPTVFLAAGARVIGDVEIGENASIWFNTVVRGDVERVRIGRDSNIQDNVVIHVTHFKNPTEIGSRVTVGHGAIIHGCTIGDGALIGMNAVVLDRAVVGRGALVAAGAVVRPGMKIPEGVLVAGIPAKVVRPLNADEIQMVEEGADNYMMYVKHYREELEQKSWDVGSFAR